MSYDIGDAVTLTTQVRDLTGTLLDATMALSLVNKDTGTVLAPSIVHAALGTYTATWTATEAGTWVYVWTASGTVTAVDDGQVEVKTVGRATVASLEELKAHLRITTTAEDGRLRDVLLGVTDIMEPMVGPVSTRTFTEFVNVWGVTVTPRRAPLISVTSLTPDLGSPIDPALFFVDSDIGAIKLRYHTRGRYTLVYAAGHAPWPAALKYAGLLICQHEWQVRNGNGGRPSPDMDALASSSWHGSGFLVPNRALEMMAPYMIPGFG